MSEAAMTETIGDLVDKAIFKEQCGDEFVLCLSGDLPLSRLGKTSGSMDICRDKIEGVVNIRANMAKQIVYGLMQQAYEMGKNEATQPPPAALSEQPDDPHHPRRQDWLGDPRI